jgi:hypothetical protein
MIPNRRDSSVACNVQKQPDHRIRHLALVAVLAGVTAKSRGFPISNQAKRMGKVVPVHGGEAGVEFPDRSF